MQAWSLLNFHLTFCSLVISPLLPPDIFVCVVGNVYTGTVDGKLWRIGPDDSLTFITQLGQNLPECGRCFIASAKELMFLPTFVGLLT